MRLHEGRKNFTQQRKQSNEETIHRAGKTICRLDVNSISGIPGQKNKQQKPKSSKRWENQLCSSQNRGKTYLKCSPSLAIREIQI